MSAQNTVQSAAAEPKTRIYEKIHEGTIVDRRTIRMADGSEINFAMVDITDGQYRKGARVTFNKAQLWVEAPMSAPGQKTKKESRIRAVNIRIVEAIAPIATQVDMPKREEKPAVAASKQPTPPAQPVTDIDRIRLQLGDRYPKARIVEQPMHGTVIEASYIPWLELRIKGTDNETYFADGRDVLDVHPVQKHTLEPMEGDMVTFYPGVRRVPVPGSEDRKDTYLRGQAYGIRFADREFIDSLRPKTMNELIGHRLIGRLGFPVEGQPNGLIFYAEGPTNLVFDIPNVEYFNPLALDSEGAPLWGHAVSFLVSYREGEVFAAAIRPLISLTKVELTDEGVWVGVVRHAYSHAAAEEPMLLTEVGDLSTALLDFDGYHNPQQRKKNAKLRQRITDMLVTEWPKRRTALQQAETERQLAEQRQREEQEANERETLRQQRRKALIARMKEQAGLKLLTLGEDDIVRDGKEQIVVLSLIEPGYDINAALALIETADNRRYELL